MLFFTFVLLMLVTDNSGLLVISFSKGILLSCVVVVDEGMRYDIVGGSLLLLLVLFLVAMKGVCCFRD